ncbi:MAG: helix-hairpin-helix domain-containing protein [Acidobacteriota bacterium]
MDHLDQAEREKKEDIHLSLLPGVGETVQGRLEEAGIQTVQELADRSLEQLMSIQGIGEKTAQRLKQSAEFLLAAPMSALNLKEADTGKEESEETEEPQEVQELGESAESEAPPEEAAENGDEEEVPKQA